MVAVDHCCSSNVSYISPGRPAELNHDYAVASKAIDPHFGLVMPNSKPEETEERAAR